MYFEMENYYAANTDVLVFATKHGYQRLVGVLERHASGARRRTLIVEPRSSPGMHVRILPTCSNPERPFIVIQERCVKVNGAVNMELILGGCKKGFRTLARYFERVSKCRSDPHGHQHLDDDEPLLVLPAVFLNIRYPVSAWNRKGLSDYSGLCFDGSEEHRVPPHPVDWDPTELSYQRLHGRIPIRR